MATLFNSERQREGDEGSEPVNDRRLWFEVAGSGVAWFALGLADLMITWRACVHEEQFGGPSAHPGAHATYFVMWLLLAGLALLAGTLSYRSWRMFVGIGDLLDSEGRERKEFMSQAGFFVSLTLGIGIVWLSLPLFIIQMCLRTR
jgi:hypothetical protein